ncbi:3-hydroxyacyl-CoA dehydrogenase [Grosmannia clavigera kw1407]|uniref:3-hydroxyacyl-CoA dehydrogenase n=1 Tax=Grosmannia clavigera (strain kw1407 / UAMH 11150) TaxID=655863 RepID=F0XQU4_GROCL|nr:3-hydroxyacyl-CoA dehydrogenase [Grosmannia clavigera kw1407]EFW99694.1 3-hydroxyacyl-CoA dehydrogenase [Grosmannia clavigera kw1407]
MDPDHSRPVTVSAKGSLHPDETKLLVLDIGVASPVDPMHSGTVLELSADGKSKKVLVTGQRLPDGIDLDAVSGRMFWTCMGVPGKDDGEVFSANLDGSDVRSIVSQGIVNTPKQLTVEPTTRKLYFCDREGMSVLRCNYDGSDLEVLVQNGDWKAEGVADCCKWCVGITVAPRLNRFYWTQKGPSKAGRGRIFSARIDGPATRDRTDIELILDHLPEPIDLEIDEGSEMLYWTDRGELPYGNSVNCAQLNAVTGLAVPADDGKPFHILSRHYNEAIGIKLNLEAGCMYVTDLSGTVYRCSLDGSSKERILSDDDCAFTGITA